MVAGVARQLLERRRIFWKTRAPEAEAGVEEAWADSRVESHSAGHLGHIGADALADVGDLVDERDLRRQERVRGELDHLGGGDVGDDALAAERGVERLKRSGGLLVAGIGADDDAIGVHEVADGGALLEELGAGDVREPGVLAADRRPGPGRDGALHHQRVLALGGQLVDHRADPREVGVAGVGRRGVDAAEQELGAVEDLVHRRREREPLGVTGDEVGEPRLVDRNVAGAQRLDLRLVDVHRDHGHAEIGEAGGGDEADPADPDHTYRLLVGGHGRGKLHLRSAGGRAGQPLSLRIDFAISSIWPASSVCSKVFVTQYASLPSFQPTRRSRSPS